MALRSAFSLDMQVGRQRNANPPVAPSAVRYNGEGYNEPHALTTAEVEELITAYGEAARSRSRSRL